MGNRVLIQFVSGKEMSPAIYGHWSGSETPTLLVALREQMSDRPGDLAYVAARYVARMVGLPELGSTGYGIWNARKRLTAKDSHGDAGVFRVDIAHAVWHVTVMDGREREHGPLTDSPNVKFTKVHANAKR
jgi:hypothetical protein